jgi:hypothetical protein
VVLPKRRGSRRDQKDIPLSAPPDHRASARRNQFHYAQWTINFGECIMKLPLIFISYMTLLGACAPYMERTFIHLSDGSSAIVLDAAPSVIQQEASQLCPFGYRILSNRAYQDFPNIWHARMVIVCNPLPENFPR